MNARARVLLAITVYNGRKFVLDAIRSACRISSELHDIDVIVLDDHSPEPGWSEEVAAFCSEAGVRYYRTPRNLGIPRNVNLGILAAHAEDYTYVIIANSDVIFPTNVVDALVSVSESDENIGSVTAWSNNVSLYSLPNVDPNKYLSGQATVDWVSSTLAGHYGVTAVDVPAGISFCILMPVRALTTIGLMDPVYGRGYCEETDWSLRSQMMGYRCTVAPGVFVYHAGKGSNESAGLLSAGATTVNENEAIIDFRYPLFRAQVHSFVASGILQELRSTGSEAILKAASRQYGYSVEVTYLGTSPDRSTPTFVIDPAMGSNDTVRAVFQGFEVAINIPFGSDIGEAIMEFADGPPSEVNLLDRGPRTQHLAKLFGVDDVPTPTYPTKV
jgi:GT2 family glycosyltransferase